VRSGSAREVAPQGVCRAHDAAHEGEAVTVVERLRDPHGLGPDGGGLAEVADRGEALRQDSPVARGREHEAEPVSGGQVVVQAGDQLAKDRDGSTLVHV
jgi:hypothetical protein